MRRWRPARWPFPGSCRRPRTARTSTRTRTGPPRWTCSAWPRRPWTRMRMGKRRTPTPSCWLRWTIACKNHQLKVYIDQTRTLVVPDTHADFVSVVFEGIGTQDQPIIFKNVRIASGGEMNMIGKKFTESKIVTHGINFDVDKATIKPESMGTLN